MNYTITFMVGSLQLKTKTLISPVNYVPHFRHFYINAKKSCQNVSFVYKRFQIIFMT